MHPDLVQALMTERVREAHAAAAIRRERRERRPRLLSRGPRPRPTWTTRAA